MYKPMRLLRSSKSLKTERDKNSDQSVFQKRSILPSVIGCCGRLLMCSMPSETSSRSKLVWPRQAVY